MSDATRSALSVILPNYNHGRLLRRAVAALLAQERKPDEIIIIDDGSTDDSLDVINALSTTSPLVRALVNATNKGVIYSLTRGLEASSGTYVYLAAAHDWVLPGFFATALYLLEHHPEAGLACGEANLVSGDKGGNLGVRPAIRPSRYVAYFPPDAVVALLKSSDNWILTGSTIFARERLLAAGGLLPEPGSFADGFLARKIALMYGFCYIPRPVAIWQIFENSFSRQTASKPVSAKQVLLAAVARFDRDPCFPRWYGALFDRRWRFAVARLAVMASPINEVVLFEIGTRNRIDKVVVFLLCRSSLGAVSRPLLLAWLWFRFMPMKLALLASSFLSRRLACTGGNPDLL